MGLGRCQAQAALPMDFAEVIPLLQIAVGPVILISGVGLLLLSITNRYGRVIDRSRVLGAEVRKAGEARANVRAQLRILLRRARLLRTSITFGVAAVLFAAVLVIGLFLGSMMHFAPTAFVVAIFSACLLSLIGSALTFLWDVNLSLSALDLDLDDVIGGHTPEALGPGKRRL